MWGQSDHEYKVRFPPGQMKVKSIKNLAKVLLAFGMTATAVAAIPEQQSDPSYLADCAVCHGDRLQGSPQAPPLNGVLAHGDSIEALVTSIAKGFPNEGMPAWSGALTEIQIKSMALYLLEARQGLSYTNYNYDTPFDLPQGLITTELYDFRFETVATGLDAQPFSIAPLPDGRILLTEKKFGLSIISNDGEQSPLIEGTPKAYSNTRLVNPGQEWGQGWMFDVAPHPEYAENGWIYIHFGDRCEGCADMSRGAGHTVSMNKIVRGRIKEGKWVDEQVIYEADISFYRGVTNIARGGRLAFDGAGHIFFSVGLGIDNHKGVQDLSMPYGKIHRINDDGSIPVDNPFVDVKGALQSIWTYGHRNPQGLEYRHSTGELWSTEHGPRGGDEINNLRPGRNFGWPLYSKGMNYNRTAVDYGKVLGIQFDLKDIEQPVVDLSPSPGVSSFIIYDGLDFPEWQDQFLVGSLKGRLLYRFVIEGDKLVHRETLFSDVARIRDIESGLNGELYVLFEHNAGSKIVRLIPAVSQY
jgi:glucose/arabinose dehydrogenase/mono/diheme cytochrome c family protein